MQTISLVPSPFLFILYTVRLLSQVVGRPDGGQSYAAMKHIMERAPGGGTPLCRHIREVVAKIREMEPQLRANCHKAVVVIATVSVSLRRFMVR